MPSIFIPGSKEGIDEGRYCRALRKDDQPTEHEHDDDDRQEPKLLAHFEELKKLSKKIHGTSELVRERIGGRTRRIAFDPVGLGCRIELTAQRVTAGEPHRPANRRKHQKVNRTQDNRIYDTVQEGAEFHP